jgi:hypothetical protein
VEKPQLALRGNSANSGHSPLALRTFNPTTTDWISRLGIGGFSVYCFLSV